jgi:UAA transporter family
MKTKQMDDTDNTTMKNVNVKDTKMPFIPLLKAGSSQLLGKVFMSMSLAYGLSFPLVVLAITGKVVPVVIGQMLLGGSKYHIREYVFSILFVVGTAMLV